MKVKTLLIFLILTIAENAYGQICSMSHYPYGWGMMNRPMMHGSEFKSVSSDLPFIDTQERKTDRYSQFWVTADVLNIRSGPSLEHSVISETYFGNLVFALAKQGDWVAIRREVTIEGVEVLPRWVHIKYLSDTPINEQVDIQVLKNRCSFSSQGTDFTDIKHFSIRLNNSYSTCGSIRNYLTHQRLLGDPHVYEEQYRDWRKSQSEPDDYPSLGC